MEKEWIVYILECGDGTLYTGITDDLQRRLRAHAAGKGAKYTRGRGPLKLCSWEAVPDKRAALKRELAIKRLPKNRKMAIIHENERKMDTSLEICGKARYSIGEKMRAVIPQEEE